MSTAHTHQFTRGESKSVIVCHCGAFQFLPEWIKASPAIVAQELITKTEARSILGQVKAQLGRNYKSAIRQAWMTGDYDRDDLGQWSGQLQIIRNAFGPTWLVNARL